jgi:hypothetical protein
MVTLSFRILRHALMLTPLSGRCNLAGLSPKVTRRKFCKPKAGENVVQPQSPKAVEI